MSIILLLLYITIYRCYDLIYQWYIVVYFHESHTVAEWKDRLKDREKDVVAVCHDEEVALEAKRNGFKDIFYAKKSDTDGLTSAVLQGVEFFKERAKQLQKK